MQRGCASRSGRRNGFDEIVMVLLKADMIMVDGLEDRCADLRCGP
jgi:hypothetical protein